MTVTGAVEPMILGDASLVELVEGRSNGIGGAFHDAVTGMAILDGSGRFRLVNPAFCRMVGRSENELVGLCPADITHPDDRPESVAMMGSLLTDQVDADQVRKRYVRPDGSVLVALRTTSVVHNPAGAVVGLFTQIVDVTAAAAAEDELRRSDTRFRALMAHASDLTVLLDGDATITYASPACTRVLGHRLADCIAHCAFDFVHPDDLSQAHAGFERLAALPGSTTLGELRVRHHDGSWRTVEAVATNLLDDPDVGALVMNVRDITDQRRYQDQLAANEQWLRALVGNSWDIITLHGRDGRYLFCSPAVTSLLGYEPDELVGSDPSTLVHPDDLDAVATYRAVVAGAAPGVAFQYRMRTRDGDWRWMESTAHNRLDDAAVGGVVVITRDVSARRRRAAQQDAVATLGGRALRGDPLDELFDRAVHLVASALGVEHCAVLQVDGDGRLTVIARAGSPLVQGPFAAEVDGRPVSVTARALREGTAVVWDSSRGSEPDNLHPNLLLAGLRSGASAVISGDGSTPYGALTVHATVPDAFSRDDISFLEATANVLAAAVGRQRMEEELRRRALHDELTGLPNRTLLVDRLTTALARLLRHPSSVAALFVDIDDFKLVNDSLGHAAGDGVVCAVVDRVVTVLRPSDAVARFGGDELVVVCEDTDAAEAQRIAERIRTALQTPIDIGDRRVVLTVSIGIATTTDPSLTPDDLLAQADTAMYSAKRAGKDRSALFDDRMRHAVTEQLDTASGLRRAVAGDELRLFYQPVVDAGTGALIGGEALLRWQHPTDGLVGPDRFIGHAEASGLIVPVGAWVLQTACRQIARWNTEGFDGHVSINVSGRQLAEPDIVASVERSIGSSGADPGHVLLEVTESAVMSDLRRSAAVIEKVRALGVRVGMDDFGTGHSSLSYLADLPFDFVKIDRSFITRLANDPRAAALLEAVATLCRTLDLIAIAEGVETEQERNQVLELGIPFIQGFLFGRPVPPAEFPTQHSA